MVRFGVEAPGISVGMDQAAVVEENLVKKCLEMYGELLVRAFIMDDGASSYQEGQVGSGVVDSEGLPLDTGQWGIEESELSEFSVISPRGGGAGSSVAGA